MKQIFHAWILLLLSLWILPVSAEEIPSLVLTVTYQNAPVINMQIEGYAIGTCQDSAQYNSLFSAINCDQSSEPETALAMEAEILHQSVHSGLSPTFTLTTDTTGTARLDSSQLTGTIYLIRCVPLIQDETQTSFQPFVLQCQPDISTYSCTIPKTTQTAQTNSQSSFTVQKLWNDADSDSSHAPVSVELLDPVTKTLITTQTLDQDHHWTYTWTQCSSSNLVIYETNIPDGYTVAQERNGSTLHLINTDRSLHQTDGSGTPQISTTPTDAIHPKEPPVTQESVSTITNTGFNWPLVLYLTASGCLFILSGLLLIHCHHFSQN